MNRAAEEYEKRTVEHNDEVNRIGRLIDSANKDISESTGFLNDVLYV
jgi:hypothetical protein